MKTNPSLIKMSQKVVYEPLYKIAGDMIRPYFLEEKNFTRLKEIGWERPTDTDPNSTNCLMNAFSNQVHEKMYGYNPYVFEIAKMVREGVMTREAGLKKFRETVPAEQIDIVKERLGL